VLAVSVEDAVGRRVVARGVHGIAAGLVEGSLYFVSIVALQRHGPTLNGILTGNRTSLVLACVIVTMFVDVKVEESQECSCGL
jgi:hypothetical protein